MKRLVLIFALALSSFSLVADEGMWLVNSIDKALEKNMRARGLKLRANEIYNADAEGASVKDAIVSLDFGCSGSMISKDGLLITNHHCAYADVYRLSLATPDHNYLDEGFWAMRMDEEVPIEGKRIQFLKKVVDITDEVERIKAEYQEKNGRAMASRKLTFDVEKQFAAPGLENMLYSMWAGSKYYMVYYKEYRDIRLVAAPPTCIAAFGGDIDNWEWPQQKVDFALYRVYADANGNPADYAESNVPINPTRTLPISIKGYKPGTYTMVMGYPGRTERYKSTSEIKFKEYVSAPAVNKLREAAMGVLKRHMEVSPQVYKEYSNSFFSLSNVQELMAGQEKCVKRFDVLTKRAALEAELQEWIMADPVRAEKWGTLLSDIAANYAATSELRFAKNIFSEVMMRCSRMGRFVLKRSNTREQFNAESEYSIFDPSTEKELFACVVGQYYKYMPVSEIGPWQDSIYKAFGCDAVKVASYIWDNSVYASKEAIAAAGPYTGSDPMERFCRDVTIQTLNKKIDELEGDKHLTKLGAEYIRAMYAWNLAKGVPQYPDANSSMRITYGTVGALQPYDAMYMNYFSTSDGILEKYDPESLDYWLSDSYREMLLKKDFGRYAAEDGTMHINFISDNDITGGNSGSAVMNNRGEIVGLAFDGNKESLAGNYDFTPAYTKCVCVDIRAVLWVLENYCPRVLDEVIIK